MKGHPFTDGNKRIGSITQPVVRYGQPSNQPVPLPPIRRTSNKFILDCTAIRIDVQSQESLPFR